MALWNLGSINTDLVYSVPHIPAPGETLSSTARAVHLGGKGANMSVAAARAGATVHHIGAVAEEAAWTRDRLAASGVDVTHVRTIDADPSQALIFVDAKGENTIVLHPGANVAIPADLLDAALAGAATGDRVLFQNETNLQEETARLAKDRGLVVCYAAAPFSASAVKAVLPRLDMLVLNRVEAEQLRAATGMGPEDLPVADVIVTMGSAGAVWFGQGERHHFDALKVTPVDTTGAGDTFTGYVLAGLDLGLAMPDAIRLAIRAAALMVTRRGTADVIPTKEEAEGFAP